MKDNRWIFGLIVVVAVIAIISVWGFKKNENGQTTESSVASEQNTAYFDNNAKVMYFYSDTCHWCIEQKKVLEKLGAAGYKVKPMNVGKDTSLWETYQISGTPTFIAASGKGERLTGYKEYDPLKDWLEKNK